MLAHALWLFDRVDDLAQLSPVDIGMLSHKPAALLKQQRHGGQEGASWPMVWLISSAGHFLDGFVPGQQATGTPAPAA